MQELTVVSLEGGNLVATDPDGAEYLIRLSSLPAPAAVRSASHTASAPKITPRQIQAYIRGGMSAADVAELTGSEIADIERFEGPILAEREFMVSTALSVSVHLTEGPDHGRSTTFGTAIRERLEALKAVGERWASWREPEGGWVVKLAFAVDGIDHDARWAFDPRRRVLEPLNPEATTISQQESGLGRGLIPRLRALSPADPDTSRFDSAAFTFDQAGLSPATLPPASVLPPAEPPRSAEPRRESAPDASRRDETSVAPSRPTADLVASLRQRRLQDSPEETAPAPVTRSATPHGEAHADPAAPHSRRRGGAPSGRRQRASIPSWDEIVFGARTDDDPA